MSCAWCRKYLNAGKNPNLGCAWQSTPCCAGKYIHSIHCLTSTLSSSQMNSKLFAVAMSDLRSCHTLESTPGILFYPRKVRATLTLINDRALQSEQLQEQLILCEISRSSVSLMNLRPSETRNSSTLEKCFVSAPLSDGADIQKAVSNDS